MQRLCRMCFGFFALAMALSSGSIGQMHQRTYPRPPGPAVEQQDQTSDAKPIRRLDTVTMEREARELSALATSIPADVEQLKKGLLPSDAVDKLRRIEKLSKQLRAQIRP